MGSVFFIMVNTFIELRSRSIFFCGEKRDGNDADLRGSLLAHPGDGQQASIHVGLQGGSKVRNQEILLMHGLDSLSCVWDQQGC